MRRIDVMWCDGVDTVNGLLCILNDRTNSNLVYFCAIKINKFCFWSVEKPFEHRHKSPALEYWQRKVKKGTKIQTWHTKNCPFQVFAATIGFTLRFYFIRNGLAFVALLQFKSKWSFSSVSRQKEHTVCKKVVSEEKKER